ncbi:MAG TPA: transglycosylase domain-containing protein, partial [Solirubrobacterales bacterium]|nr:transglycosylase domain-containing protein [Solirubrobacterales bacterium]
MTQRQRRRQRGRGGAGGKLILLFAAVIGAIVIALAAGGGWMLSIAADTEDVNTLQPLNKGRNSIVYAGDGSRLGYIRSDQIRQPVPYAELPRNLRDATVAIEDRRFYQHSGVDIEGAARALVENITAQRIVEGGSTITMQLMRNLYITDPQRDFDRKLREAAMAMDYEEANSKQRILTQYLNTASYGTLDGNTAVGVGAASNLYFSKPVEKLSLPQAALLAGLPQAPTDYNPVLNPAGATERRNEVLTRMAEQGYISPERALKAHASGLQLNISNQFTTIREPLFFDYVEDDLINKYGVSTVRQGGLEVHTTIDPELQDAGRAAIESHLYLPEDPSSAIVAIDPQNGEIKAMVSSATYAENKYNLAVQGRRQPGSTFKTFVLATAVNQGIDPDSTYYVSKPLDLDLPEYGEWEVSTYSNSYGGSTSITSGTLASDNTVYAQLALDVGPAEVAETARSMGITTELDGYPAEALGGLRLGVSPVEMASAYATLAAGGVHHPPVAISKVVFPNGRVDQPQSEEPRRAMGEAEAYEVTRILGQNMTGGTGTSAYTGCTGQAGKTGTTDRFTDAWFVGYQPNVSISVWVGYPESNAIEMTSVHGESVAGGTFPARIWNSFYTTAGLECVSPEVPAESPEWIPFTSGFTASAEFDKDGDDSSGEDEEFKYEDDYDFGGNEDGEFDPDQYAPGAGQDALG